MASPSKARAALGVSPPKRSTLAEAHERRPAALSHRLLATLYARGQAMAPGHGCRFQNPLLSLDSTTISRCLNRFPGARFRTAKGAIKVLTRRDHAGPLPAFGVMPAGQRRAIARGRQRPKGSIGAMERGDIDDTCLFSRTPDRVYLVTRQQVHATYQVTARLAVNWLPGVTSDQNVVLRGKKRPCLP